MPSPSPFQRLTALAVGFVLCLMFVADAEAQLFRRGRVPTGNCPDGTCPPLVVNPSEIYVQPAPVVPVPVSPAPLAEGETAESLWYKTLRVPTGDTLSKADEATIRSWAGRAVRILNGNSCGTGSLCGRDDTGIYILTNAHVASSKIGNVVQCEALKADKSGTEKFSARVIEAAYSSRTSTDWALLKADARFMKDLEPIKLSTTDPDSSELTGTWGCPRCEVPSGQLCKTNSLGSLWYWQPNSIGGQSGSAVVQGGKQKGLLTWTINGNGAGQKTATIYKQSKEKNTDGPARVDGLEFPSATGAYSGVELIEGYHCETSSLADYPIWDTEPPAGGGGGSGGGGTEPPKPPVMSDAEKELRALVGDWESFVKAVLPVLKLVK